MTAIPDDRDRCQPVQLESRELDLYGSQLARCLKALGTNAPIRADVQHELATVRAEQQSRAKPANGRPLSGRFLGELNGGQHAVVIRMGHWDGASHTHRGCP